MISSTVFVIVLAIFLFYGCSPKNDISKDQALANQIWTGRSVNDSYQCFVKKYAEDSVLFVYQYDDFAVYAEHRGIIKHKSDSVYEIAVTMNFGAFICKGLPDAFIIGKDTNIRIDLNSILIQYKDASLMVEKSSQERIRSFYINDSLIGFNEKADILVDYIHPFTMEPLVLPAHRRGAMDFVAGDKDTFDVVITKGQFKTINDSPAQTGHFLLNRK